MLYILLASLGLVNLVAADDTIMIRLWYNRQRRVLTVNHLPFLCYTPAYVEKLLQELYFHIENMSRKRTFSGIAVQKPGGRTHLC